MTIERSEMKVEQSVQKKEEKSTDSGQTSTKVNKCDCEEELPI